MVQDAEEGRLGQMCGNKNLKAVNGGKLLYSQPKEVCWAMLTS